MNPLVSILIPVYNRVTLVGETIESAINQTYQNIEIIIVDNFSTDGTWELLNEYALKDKRIRIFQNIENVGPVRNWIECLKFSKGDFIKMLFSDDLISSGFILEGITLFDQQTDFVISPVFIFDSLKNEKMGNYDHFISIESKKYLEDILLLNEYVLPFSPSCAIFRRSNFQSALILSIDNNLGLKFEDFGAGNDLLIFLNCLNLENNVKIMKNNFSYFRSHGGSITVSNKLNLFYNYSKYYYMSKFLPELLPKFKSIIFIRSLTNKGLIKLRNIILCNMDYHFAFIFIFKYLKSKFNG